jgi:hypothetical protein
MMISSYWPYSTAALTESNASGPPTKPSTFPRPLLKHWHRAIKRPVVITPRPRVGNEQREAVRTLGDAPAHFLHQRRCRGGAVGDDQHAP